MISATIVQTGILVTGTLCILLIALKNRWGPVVGLLGEFFWFYAAIEASQWGIFILTIVYTISWLWASILWWRTKHDN